MGCERYGLECDGFRILRLWFGLTKMAELGIRKKPTKLNNGNGRSRKLPRFVASRRRIHA